MVSSDQSQEMHQKVCRFYREFSKISECQEEISHQQARLIQIMQQGQPAELRMHIYAYLSDNPWALKKQRSAKELMQILTIQNDVLKSTPFEKHLSLLSQPRELARPLPPSPQIHKSRSSPIETMNQPSKNRAEISIAAFRASREGPQSGPVPLSYGTSRNRYHKNLSSLEMSLLSSSHSESDLRSTSAPGENLLIVTDSPHSGISTE